MNLDLVIKGGKLVTAGETLDTDLGVRGGRIAALGSDLSGTQVIDARGLLVLPEAGLGHLLLGRLQGLQAGFVVKGPP